MAFGEIAPKSKARSSLELITGVAETPVYANGNSGTSFTINLDNGNLQTIIISGAVTLAFAKPRISGKFTIVIKMDSTGHVYGTTGVIYPSGTTPSWSSAANKIDILSLIYDGTNLYGMTGIAFA